jgi:nucleoid DNA-binding protein
MSSVSAKKETVAKKSKSLAVQKPMTKSEILTTIAEHLEFRKTDVAAVLETLSDIIHAHVGKKGPGIFTLPGLFKIEVVKKPAVKARKGVNPFTGLEMEFAAKPASRKVKIKALKQLKDTAN